MNIFKKLFGKPEIRVGDLYVLNNASKEFSDTEIVVQVLEIKGDVVKYRFVRGGAIDAEEIGMFNRIYAPLKPS